MTMMGEDHNIISIVITSKHCQYDTLCISRTEVSKVEELPLEDTVTTDTQTETTKSKD